MLNTTPMMKQYHAIKVQHAGALVFFRLGDFYELFYEDAAEASHLLSLTLTKRNGVPMCGVPFHAATNYIRKLLDRGKKVVLCDQVGQVQTGKLVERQVVEVITPGMIVDESFLEGRVLNYIVALCRTDKHFVLAALDFFTGELNLSWSFRDDWSFIRRELYAYGPRELLVEEELFGESELKRFCDEISPSVESFPHWYFDAQKAQERILHHFGVKSLAPFGLSDMAHVCGPLGLLLDYVYTHSKKTAPHIRDICVRSEKDALLLDEASQRNLELIQNLRGSVDYTLLRVLDQTTNPLGARLLRRTLRLPSAKLEEIQARHRDVALLKDSPTFLYQLRDALGGVFDIERLLTRVLLDKAHARDLLSLERTLGVYRDLHHLFLEKEINLSIVISSKEHEDLEELYARLHSAIHREASPSWVGGALLREHYHQELDELRREAYQSREILDEYLLKERSVTGISSLKLKYNRVLGHFLELPRSLGISVLPQHFIHRQSISEKERYLTEELKKIEERLLSAEERFDQLERRLFIEFRHQMKDYADVLRKLATFLSYVDLMASFAVSALERHYVQPEMCLERVIDIVEGRHPVVEIFSGEKGFVPNDAFLDSQRYFALVTGPNMAGKSTYLRQVALMVLMAQMGSYVPAHSARLGLVDKIFCRVGASDNLARGESTFLVEMQETAYILRSATRSSLVIMDEIGRGTSTHDGLSLAWAISEVLLEKICARTYFATHYHELIHLNHSAVQHLSLEVRIEGEKIYFLHRLQKEASLYSYGIHVALLAGIPQEVVMRAREVSRLIEAGEMTQIGSSWSLVSQKSSSYSFIEALRQLHLDTLSPLDAFKLVVEWKNEMDS